MLRKFHHAAIMPVHLMPLQKMMRIRVHLQRWRRCRQILREAIHYRPVRRRHLLMIGLRVGLVLRLASSHPEEGGEADEQEDA